MLEMCSPLTQLSHLGVIHFDEVRCVSQAVKGERNEAQLPGRRRRGKIWAGSLMGKHLPNTSQGAQVPSLRDSAREQNVKRR